MAIILNITSVSVEHNARNSTEHEKIALTNRREFV